MARLTKEQRAAKLEAKLSEVKMQLAAEANPDLAYLIATERKLRRMAAKYTEPALMQAADAVATAISGIMDGSVKSTEQAEMFPSGS